MKIKATLIFVFFSYLSFGQSPQKFTYQSIIKNSSGYLLKNQDVGLRISVLSNSSNGIEVYSEEHFPTSNSNGLVTLIIGEGLTNDNFSEIQWGDGEFFLKVEVDPEGGNNYTMNQTSQLLSVPYALYAENSGSKLNLLGQDFITLQDQTLTINKVDLTDDVDGVLPVANGGTGSSTVPMVGVITAVDSPAARVVLGLGTAATENATAFATAAQGALADTALQDATVFATAAQGALADTALQDATAFATAAQGALADTALQDATAFATAAQGALADTALQDATAFATAAQGALADTALQDATAFATAAQGALADTALQDATAFATAAQGALADTALQDATAFATAAQGALADTALQDATAFATAAQGALADTALQDATAFATAAQGALADTALQASNNLSDITNVVAARTALGIDVSGTDNSTNVSLATVTDNYLSLSNQEITAGTIPVSLGGTGSTTAPMVGVITAANAAAARTVLGVDASGTDNSTNVSLANTNYLSISGQEITGGTIPISSGGTGATTASAARTALGVDGSGTDNSTNVSLATVTDNYLSLSNQEITAGTIPVSLGGTGSTTAPMVGVITAANAAAARTVLGVDASGTDNSTNVSLAGSLDYLTLSNQEITLGQVDYDTDISNTPTLLQLGTTSSTALAGNTTTITTTQSNAITTNSAKVSDSGTPALKSDGSDPSLNTGITAAEIRSLIGVDGSGTDNSTNVSLAGSLDYLTLSNQEITLGQVDYDTDISNTPTLLQLGTTSSTALAGNTTTITTTQSNAITTNSAKVSDSGTPALKSDGSDPSLNTGITAAEIRSLIGVDGSGTDNSTNVSLAGSLDYLTLSNQEITLGQVDYDTDISNTPTLLQLGTTSSTALAGNTTTITTTQSNAITTNSAKVSDSGTPALKSDGSDPSLNTGITAAEIRSLIGVDGSGTDNSTNVSLATVTDNYLSLSNQEITAGTIPVSLGGTGSTTAPMVGVITAANAAAARTVLGVDASGTDNSTNVSLANTNYLSISGQEITGGTIPISSGGTGATTASAARTALGLSSLSIGGSTGGGTVDISSEQLRIVGTLNEVVTSASNQTITVGLPSYVYVNLVGDVQGDVTGNLSGSQVSINKIINPAQTVSTAGGTITLNGMSGRFRISALSTSKTINNDIIDSGSVLICTISSANSNDYFISSAVPAGSSGSGSFTVTLDQIPAYDVDINFFIMN